MAPPLHRTRGLRKNIFGVEERDARDCSTVTNDSCDRSVEFREPFARLQIGRVEVLRTMGQEVESGHQQHGVDAEQPVVLEHTANLVEENACL